MKNLLPSLLMVFLLHPADAAVRVFVTSTNGFANLNYQCTAGEVVRAFALDVTVDRGQILGVTNFSRGLSTPSAPGYGIFPASFRDNITVASGTNANWTTNLYSPLAVVADNPSGTLPGLGSSGVTLEFGALCGPNGAKRCPAIAGHALLPADQSDGERHGGRQYQPRRHYRGPG